MIICQFLRLRLRIVFAKIESIGVITVVPKLLGPQTPTARFEGYRALKLSEMDIISAQHFSILDTFRVQKP
jgi:hypothetical protein